jgi:hypothetical protein
MSDSALVGSCTVGHVARTAGRAVPGRLGVGTCNDPEVCARAHMVNDSGRMRQLGGSATTTVWRGPALSVPESGDNLTVVWENPWSLLQNDLSWVG